jgi:hypothetical protein
MGAVMAFIQGEIRRRKAFPLVVESVALLLLAGAATVQENVNFVLIYTDDQGWADLGAYGATDIETPNLDLLAAEGMRFTGFYVASPVCTPSRAASG